ncbi:MAG: hypothetical protein GY803_16005 [Chloroflexi bacterium]|nr:hypothetical protein [Chloroflexota bacterium]
MQRLKLRADWLWIGLIVGTAVALLFDLPIPWPQALAFSLLVIWPAIAWSRWLKGDWTERLLSAAALALLLNVLSGLILSYVPGAVERPLQLILHTFFALLPYFRRQKQKSRPMFSIKSGLPVLAILLTAVLLRLANLGYGEFQGDEGTIMMRAAAIIAGDDAEIFLHQKGPVEILLPLSLWGIAGTINEFWARLPFAWAGILAVGAVMLLAQRWFGRFTGLAAGVLFAIVGFAVAFGRIIQYQSLVMLWSALALFHAYRYTRDEQRSDLGLTAVFLAGGLLAHYDAVLVVPAIGWLLLRYLWEKRRLDWQAWGAATAVGGLILAIFYAPFALDPNFARTGRYLLQDRVGGGGQGFFSWSGPAVWRMVTFYNSLYFIVGLSGLMLVGLWILWRRREWTAVKLTAVIYFLAPFLFYLFIVADPRTHVYTFFPGAVILAAVGAQFIWQKLSANRPLQYAAAAGFALFWLVSVNYIYLMFVDNAPERQRSWVENKPAFYPTTWSEPPLYGLFGFPHQAGWRVVHEALPANAFPYASNEEREVTTWYMAQSPRTHCPNFDTFILAENAQDEIPYDPAWLESLHLRARVLVNGRPSLQIFGRQPVDTVQAYEATQTHRWLTPVQMAPPQTGGAHPVNIRLGNEQIDLVGYDLDDVNAFPGGQLIVTLYWKALVPFDQNYQAFVHLYDGELRAQHDGAPECAVNPTTRWEPGQIIADPHIIPIPPDMPIGEIAALAGMYDLVTGERLSIPGAIDNTIHLTDVAIKRD